MLVRGTVIRLPFPLPSPVCLGLGSNPSRRHRSMRSGVAVDPAFRKPASNSFPVIQIFSKGRHPANR